MMINDLPLYGQFRVFDRTTGRIIFESAGGDIPPDVAMLEVLTVYCCDDTICLDVVT